MENVIINLSASYIQWEHKPLTLCIYTVICMHNFSIPRLKADIYKLAVLAGCRDQLILAKAPPKQQLDIYSCELADVSVCLQA